MLPVEVYDGVGKSVIHVCKKARKRSQMHFIMAVKKSRKRSQSGFLFIHILKTAHLQQIKEMQSSKLDM